MVSNSPLARRFVASGTSIMMTVSGPAIRSNPANASHQSSMWQNTCLATMMSGGASCAAICFADWDQNAAASVGIPFLDAR